MSTWDAVKKTVRYPKLAADLETDVAIVGAGMAGSLLAYILSKEGYDVCLIEKNEIGNGATAATTAFITEVIDTPYSEISSLFGPSMAKAVHDSQQKAVEEFRNIIRSEKMDCEFVTCPNYAYASDRKQREKLAEEYRTYQRFKWPAVFHPEGLDLGFPNTGVLEIPDQAKFHPKKFLFGILSRAEKNGAHIFERSEVTDIEGEAGNFLVSTKTGSLTAKHVVIATYKPLVNDKTHLKKAMYKSYVLQAEIPKGAFPEALYEDAGNPYHYFRIEAGGEHDRIIVGGEDHKDIFGRTLDKKSFQALGAFLEKLMGGRRYWIVDKWTGPILEPSDGLPLIGEISPGRFVATAFSGNGMTYSLIAALLIRDLITGKPNPWKKAYDPKRSLLHPKRLASKAKDYLEEFVNGALKNMLS